VVTGFVFHTMLVASAFMLVKGKPDDRRPESHSGGQRAAVHCPSSGFEKWVRSISGVRTLNTSFDHFDTRAVTWRFGERRVAGHDGSIERLA
jgi:hypothetical protein